MKTTEEIITLISQCTVFKPTLLKLPETLSETDMHSHIEGLGQEISSLRKDLAMWKTMHGSYMTILDKAGSLQRAITEMKEHTTHLEDTVSNRERDDAARASSIRKLEATVSKLKEENAILKDAAKRRLGCDVQMQRASQTLRSTAVDMDKQIRLMKKEKGNLETRLLDETKRANEMSEELSARGAREDVLVKHMKEFIPITNEALYRLAISDEQVKKLSLWNGSLLDLLRTIGGDAVELVVCLSKSYEKTMRFARLYYGIRDHYGITSFKESNMATTQENVLRMYKGDFYDGMKETIDDGVYKSIGRVGLVNCSFLGAYRCIGQAKAKAKHNDDDDAEDDVCSEPISKTQSRMETIVSVCKRLANDFMGEGDMIGLARIIGDMKNTVIGIRDLDSALQASGPYLAIISSMEREKTVVHILESIASSIILMSHPNDAVDMSYGIMGYETQNVVGGKIKRFTAFQLGIEVDCTDNTVVAELIPNSNVGIVTGWCNLKVSSWRKIATAMACVDRFHGKKMRVVVRGFVSGRRGSSAERVVPPSRFVTMCASHVPSDESDNTEPELMADDLIHRGVVIDGPKTRHVTRSNIGYQIGVF